MEKDFQNFQEFWPFYLSQHLDPTCRILHVIGTSASVAFFGYCLFNQSWLQMLWCLPLGYGPAWIGHFGFEKNRPATFKYPRYSFFGDFKMLTFFFTGKLTAEIERLNLKRHS